MQKWRKNKDKMNEKKTQRQHTAVSFKKFIRLRYLTCELLLRLVFLCVSVHYGFLYAAVVHLFSAVRLKLKRKLYTFCRILLDGCIKIL